MTTKVEMRFNLNAAIRDLQARADYLSERHIRNGGTRFHDEYCDVVSLIGRIKQYIVDHEEKYYDL